ncbi:MAG: succinylglutamate-semialdehyde dehydrogenase [Alteromonadaceae bacterium]|nr:succinylglutamate-semialdehyde dehydrogenase [Alteromonadaceae bacterium]
MNTNFIKGTWQPAAGRPLTSINPANGKALWHGKCSTPSEVQHAVDAASQAFSAWRLMSDDERYRYLHRFNDIIEAKQHTLASLISQESGKPLWEAHKEVSSVLSKLTLSQQACNTRTGHQQHNHARLQHSPVGVMAVFGPYNFPCHLANGHIIPALLAGNTVVFKPSELTPACGEFMVRCWQEAELPDGVINLVQGDKTTGQALASATGVNGVLFTGSEKTGLSLHRQFAGQPEVMLALELGGNNPLVISDLDNPDAAVDIVLESAFISSGQRCTCARRLLVPTGAAGDDFTQALVNRSKLIPIDQPDAEPAPFMAAMISHHATAQLLAQQQALVDAGATILVACRRLALGDAFISPGIIDITALSEPFDDEVFGPLLQIIRYDNFDQAIELANATRFGLSAGLIGGDAATFDYFKSRIRAGIINWNMALTGASSAMPFGGVGRSGNYRPSAFYAADYCRYPVASLAQHDMPDSVLLTPFLPAISGALNDY